MNKKVVIFCPFSYPSACGIWARVQSDAKALISSGYEVYVFSSNIIKGTPNTSSSFEEFEGIKIYRFEVKFSLGGSSMFWDFSEKLAEVNPDIIHTHGFRHPHSLFSLVWGKFKRKKVLLTTHAPFNKDENRSLKLKLFDVLYDLFIAWWELRLYSKVIRISKWEEKYLKNLWLNSSVYIPNGIKKIFIENSHDPLKMNQKKNQVLYMGRIDPVKRIEWIQYAAKSLPEINFRIEGPLNGYSNLESDSPNLKLFKKKYSSEEFIDALRESDIYVLASIREGLPFSLLEAMSQGIIAIASSTDGSKEVIEDGVNGFIVDSKEELVEKIEKIYADFDNLSSLRLKAVETAGKFSGDISDKKLIELYNSL